MRRVLLKKNWIYEVLLLLAVGLWGSSFALTKPLLSVMGVFTFMAYRFLIGGLALTFFLIIIGRFKPGRHQIKGGIITGLLLFLAFIFHTYGLKYTSASKNAFIVGSNVIFVPFIMMIFRKERQPKQVWLSTVLAIVGLGLVTLDGDLGGFNFGDALTVIGTLIISFYILSVEKYVREGSPLTVAAIQVTSVGIFSLVPTLIFETVSVEWTPLGIQNILILGVGCTSIAYVIANYCQQYLSAERTALLYVFEPIFGALLGMFLLGDRFGIQGIIGALLITFATAFPAMVGRGKL